MIKKKAEKTVREYVWEKVRELKKFTISDILERAPKKYKLQKRKVRYYLIGWEAAGILSKKERKKTSSPAYVYTLLKDCGAHPLICNEKGKEIKAHLSTEQMWRTMRMIGTFNHSQLAALASTDEIIITDTVAKRYTRAMARAGFLKVVKKGTQYNGLTMYQLKPSPQITSNPPRVNVRNTEIKNDN